MRNWTAFLSILVLILGHTFAKDFVLVDSVMNWWNAETYCQQRYKTNLATIYDDISATNALSLTTNINKYVWIGLREEPKGSWWFADGTQCPVRDGECVTYWDVNEPNDWNGEDCACIAEATSDIQSMLNDLQCGWADPIFICNKPEPKYVFVEQHETWKAAETYCQNQYETHLATIFDDDSAQDLLNIRMLYGDDVWIGLNKTMDGIYGWASGILCPMDTGCDPSNYSYWDSVYASEYCAAIVHSDSIFTMLNDRNCTDTQAFVCDAPDGWVSSAPTPFPTSYPTVSPTANTLSPSTSPTNPILIPPTIPPTITSTSLNPTTAPTNPILMPPTISPTITLTSLNPTTVPTSVPTLSPTDETISPSLLFTTYDETIAPMINNTFETKDGHYDIPESTRSFVIIVIIVFFRRGCNEHIVDEKKVDEADKTVNKAPMLFMNAVGEQSVEEPQHNGEPDDNDITTEGRHTVDDNTLSDITLSDITTGQLLNSDYNIGVDEFEVPGDEIQTKGYVSPKITKQ